ncbi:MAG: GHMP kinase [Bacteroidota bacterium]
MISIKVPARICFYGDHQDYLGLPVIAGTIDRYIELTARPLREAEFQLNLPDIGAHRVIPLKATKTVITPKDYLLSAMTILEREGFEFKRGYQIEISGDIPVNAGLSSSSALTVAWIRFLIAVQDDNIVVSDTKIGHWAYQAEVEFFDSPGGLMDQYTIAQKGLLFIDTKTGKTKKLKGHLGKLVVAESGISKKTLEVLKNARTYQEKAIDQVEKQYPDFKISNSKPADYHNYLDLVTKDYKNHWYAAIYNYDITMKANRFLLKKDPDITKLGHLMNAHQRILENQIGNTPKEMMAMINAARNAGALGVKTIGSGGGGSMVAMVSDTSKEPVIDAFINNGAANAYEVQLTYP